QVVVGEGLVAEQHHRVVMPSLDHAGKTIVVKPAQIAGDYLGAECGSGRDHLEGRGIAPDRRFYRRHHGRALRRLLEGDETSITGIHRQCRRRAPGSKPDPGWPSRRTWTNGRMDLYFS